MFSNFFFFPSLLFCPTFSLLFATFSLLYFTIIYIPDKICSFNRIKTCRVICITKFTILNITLTICLKLLFVNRYVLLIRPGLIETTLIDKTSCYEKRFLILWCLVSSRPWIYFWNRRIQRGLRAPTRFCFLQINAPKQIFKRMEKKRDKDYKKFVIIVWGHFKFAPQ